MLLAKHGLKMNFSKGKTECIMRPFGRGSQELVAGLQRIDGQKVTTVDDAVVRIVRSYKHLGTIHTATGNMTEEAADSVEVSRHGLHAGCCVSVQGRCRGAGGPHNGCRAPCGTARTRHTNAAAP